MQLNSELLGKPNNDGSAICNGLAVHKREL